MKRATRLLRFLTVVTLLLLLHGSAESQKTSPGQAPVLLEMVYTSVGQQVHQTTTRVYADGYYVSEGEYYEKANSGRNRKVSHKREKQLESGEMTELINWAEQPDFVNAQPEYVVKIVQDWPSHITIVYRNKGREKKVVVANYNAGSAEEKAKVPPSVLKLARWADPYSF